MKNSILKVLFLVAAIVSLAYGVKAVKNVKSYYNFEFHETNDVKEPLVATVQDYTVHQKVTVKPPFVGKSFTGFKEALGFKESRGNYFIVNQLGYLGKYQFGRGTLRAFGIHDTNAFLNNPELQEKVFVAYLSRNKAILHKEIKQYVGKTYNGVLVTESGILAAAHLGGAGNVKKYLRSAGRTRFKDANGASVQYYMKKFGGYDVSFIKANRQAQIM